MTLTPAIDRLRRALPRIRKKIRTAERALESQLTKRQREVMSSLRSAHRNGTEWCRPMDVGGFDQSHHSRTLKQLARLGFVEQKGRGMWMSMGLTKQPGSYLYRAKGFSR